jgi:hypothetical protein
LIIPPADPEANLFAEKLQRIFLDAGWNAEREGGMSFGAVLEFHVIVRNLESPPARAASVRRAIAEGLGEEVRMSQQPSMREDELQLSVPHRRIEGQ